MNDDTLILYYYGDGLTDDERAAVRSALATDPSVQERYRALCRSLDGFGDFPVTQAPPGVTARWHRSISRAAAAEPRDSASRGRTWHPSSFAWGALAAAFVVVIAVALYAVRPPPSVVDRGDIAPPAVFAAAPASFTRGVEVHLRQTRQDLERMAPENEDRAKLIRDILRQNRLFERTAEAHSADDVARVLRAFEIVLLRLAAGDISEEDALALRAQLEFELDVMLTKLQRRESQQAELI